MSFASAGAVYWAITWPSGLVSVMTCAVWKRPEAGESVGGLRTSPVVQQDQRLPADLLDLLDDIGRPNDAGYPIRGIVKDDLLYLRRNEVRDVLFDLATGWGVGAPSGPVGPDYWPEIIAERTALVTALKTARPAAALNTPPASITEPFTRMLWGITTEQVESWLGAGEALNEHIVGEYWPEAPVRLERLMESIEIIERLFEGKVVKHRGQHFNVESAKLYTLPDSPPPWPAGTRTSLRTRAWMPSSPSPPPPPA